MSDSGSSGDNTLDENTPLLDSMTVDNTMENELRIATQTDTRRKGSSLMTATLIMINATLGGGLLNFPEAFNLGGGILSSMAVQIFLALLAGFSFMLISWLSDIRGCLTYQDTIGSMCGPTIKNICTVIMIFYTYGSCVAYFIIVGDESDRVFYSFYGPDFCQRWYLNRKFIIIAASMVLILPFCYAKKIDFLKYASGLATVGVVYFIFLVVLVYFKQDSSERPVTIKTKPDHWVDIFKIIPTICFAYQSHLSVVPTYACMENRSLKPLGIAVFLSTFVSFLAYSIVGIFGYLTFGANVKPDILSSFDVNGAAVAIGFFAFAVKVFLTYPVMEYVGREALETSWVQIFRLDMYRTAMFERKRRFWFASLWFATTLLIGIFVPDIMTVIGLLGSFAALFIFVFPGLCLLQTIFLMGNSLGGQTTRRLAFVIAFAFIVIGAFIFGLIIAQLFEDFMKRPQPAKVYFSIGFRDPVVCI